MLNELFKFNNSDNSVNELIRCIRQGIPSAAFGVSGAFKEFIVSAMPYPVLYIVKDGLTANKSAKIIEELTNKKVVVLPQKDEQLIKSLAFSKDNIYARQNAVYKVKDADVIVGSIESILQSVPLKILDFKIEKDVEYDIEKIVSTLVDFGYTRVEKVEYKGTFSVRGDVLEIFPINLDLIYRVDFFGDVVETIKRINPDNRENLGFINSFKFISATETPISLIDKKKVKDTLLEEKKIFSGKNNLRLFERVNEAIDSLDTVFIDELFPITNNFGFIFDIISKDTVVIFNEAKPVYEVGGLIEKEFIERFNSLYNEGEVFSFSKNQLLSIDIVKDKIREFKVACVQTLSTIIPFFNPLKIVNPVCSAVVDYSLDFKEMFLDVDNWLRGGYSVLICTADNARSTKLNFELSNFNIASTIDGDILQGACISSEKLTSGFVFHEEKVAVIGSGNLYLKPKSERKVKTKKQPFFTAPEAGDYCVHEVHGIGRVLGNKKISSTEGTKDYVAVEYNAGDVLYVPVEQMDLLTRYLGGEKKPTLSKIGGKDFDRVKRNVIDSIKKMSFDLKRLYEERQAQKGFAFTDDTELTDYFIDRFPYEDTPDQFEASKNVLADMQSPLVMDRLICGDVGFGKTEVAFRAVFLAVINGKQAVMLAPTTILTEQHYSTALERFKDFGIRIACLNRFRTPKQQAEIISKLKTGELDFVIGTHKLLNKEIQYKDLGLLVLDEEQRFGVEHKEKIKLIKTNVDTLTLTATPIPRTLHMSLSGIRSISTINTPPKKRLPVQTYVTEETEVLIKDAISREINRGGQAFILYNRVESIDAFSERIKSILPEIKISVVHGQMEERKLEKRIMEFYRGESQVLISTTIIENGIDLPKANTLIVIDADKLGLSTLYQLKGRVGRSDRLAYAYFTFKKEKVMTDTAYKRLNAIVEFAEMGSGIKIAMRDLEIRGAGNVLGKEQHGHMDKIGYELYSKLLKEELSGEIEVIPELDVRVSALIPDKYIESNSSKMGAYKEIAEIADLKDARRIKKELTEEYGEVPMETLNLIKIALAKRYASKLRVSEIVIKSDLCALIFEDVNAFNNNKLAMTVDKYKEAYVSVSNKFSINFDNEGKTNEQMLELVLRFLNDSVS